MIDFRTFNRLGLIWVVFGAYVSTFAQKPTLVIPRGHALKVTQIEPSHDYRLVATIDDSPIIHIWDAETHEEYYQFYEHPVGLVNVDFHPSELGFASSDRAGNVFIWNLARTQIDKKIELDRAAYVRFTQDGQALLTAEEGLLRFWNHTNTKELKSIAFDGTVSCLEVSAADGHIYVGTTQGSVLHYDSQGELQGTYDLAEAIHAVAPYQTSAQVAVATTSGKVTLINEVSGDVAASESHFSNGAHSLALVEGQNVLVAVGNDSEQYIRFLEPASMKDATPKKFKWASVPKDDQGLRAVAVGDADNNRIYFSNHDNVIEKWDIKESKWQEGIFKGTLRPVYQMDLDPDNERLIIASWQKPLKIFDLTGANFPVLLEGHSRGTNYVDYHPDLDVAISIGNDAELTVWNTETQEVIERFNKLDIFDSRVFFTTGHNFLWRKDRDEFELVNYESGNKRSMKLSGVVDYKLSSDAAHVHFMTTDALQSYTAFDIKPEGKVSVPGIRDFACYAGGVMALDDQRQVHLINDGQITRTYKLEQDVDRIYAMDRGEFVVYQSKPLLRSNTSGFHYDSEGKFLSELSGHQDYITDVLSLNDRLLTSSIDGTIKIWQRDQNQSYTEAGRWILLRYTDYVLTTPNQLFDAPSEAMKELHYLLNGEVVAVEQMKDTYYEPNLVSKLLGFVDGDLRQPKQLSELGIYPEFEIKHPNLNDGLLGINLTNKGGGIGKVVLVINGKEVSNDVRDISNSDVPQMGITYDINGHPYLKNGINTITIKAYNQDGSLGSEAKTIKVLYEEKEETKPSVFAVIAGVSDYQGEELDLKYAAKDAGDFAKALELSAQNLIGSDNLNIKLLTTDLGPENHPTKANIKKAFDEFSRQATAKDYLVVYIAGHGTNAKEEGGDFLYLTADAADDNFQDLAVREKSTISSFEFTELIKSVPALKQVMIVDACHSGTLMSTLDKKQTKTMNSDEVRAFERIKDRPGYSYLRVQLQTQ